MEKSRESRLAEQQYLDKHMRQSVMHEEIYIYYYKKRAYIYIIRRRDIYILLQEETYIYISLEEETYIYIITRRDIYISLQSNGDKNTFLNKFKVGWFAPRSHPLSHTNGVLI